jgi:Neuraminidase (sialidase)
VSSLFIYLLAFSLSCSSGGAAEAIDLYKKGGIVFDKAGTAYKAAPKSNFPKGYGVCYHIQASTDGGKTWGERGRIDASKSYDTWGFTLAASSDGKLYFAYSTHDILVSRSEDAGKTWSGRVIVNSSSSGGMHPAVCATSDGTVCAAWVGGNRLGGGLIWVNVSRDGGRTWGKSARQRTGTDVSLATDGAGTVYLGYLSANARVYFLAHSTDRGATWHTEATEESMPIFKPKIYCIGSTVYLIGSAFGFSALPMPGRKPSKLAIRTTSDKGKTWSGLRLEDYAK